MANCSQCNQPKCSCPPLPCVDCVQPEAIVIKKIPQNTCDDLQDYIDEQINNNIPECALTWASPLISGRDVTIQYSGSYGTLQFSNDGISWQQNPTFTNQPNGTTRFYVREISDLACVASGYVTVNVACVPDTNWKPVTPINIECIDEFANYQEKDDCGNLRWVPTDEACDNCTPNWVDVIPELTRCFDNHIEIRTQDGCGNFDWRVTEEECEVCAPPIADAGYGSTSATCGNGSTINNNAQIQITGVTGANKYAFALASNPVFLPYASAYQVPLNGTITIGGLMGSSAVVSYIIRLYNGSDDCYFDKVAATPAVNCSSQCVTPDFTFSKQDPTCNGSTGETNSNGKLLLSNYTNAAKYQLCIDTTFTCTPNFPGAIPIAGSGIIEVSNSFAFFFDQPYRDVTLRVYGNSESCYRDRSFRFVNPCYVTPGCTPPVVTTATPTAATCTGTVPNNDASIDLTGITGGVRYSFSLGNVYSGPDFSGATVYSGSSINIPNLIGSANSTNYVVRVFGSANNCFVDKPVTVPGVNCESGSCCTMEITSVEMVNI